MIKIGTLLWTTVYKCRIQQQLDRLMITHSTLHHTFGAIDIYKLQENVKNTDHKVNPNIQSTQPPVTDHKRFIKNHGIITM